ncbi:MAG: hypothetical protein KGY70_16285 [Bacteroidales bacterium]|nr:hypothetical protein [Bacteroidales bacterium]
MIEDLFHDYGIDTAPEDNKHYRPGWINVECPFCGQGSGKYHLGFNIKDGYFHCWNCGTENAWSVKRTIAKLIGVSEKEAVVLIKTYRISMKGGKGKEQAKVSINKKQFRLPPDSGEMKKNHRRYLEKRRFDPDWLEQEWKVMGTGPMAKLDEVDYKHRILTPIYWNNQMVSFQTRDITGKHSMPYLACPQEREIMYHKHIIYTNPSYPLWEWGICVEGKFDAWRFGHPAFATFGIGYTSKQVTLIASLFKQVYTVFDPEPQAQRQAEDLKGELRFRGVECHNIKLKSDPGDLPQDEADYIIKQLKRR